MTARKAVAIDEGSYQLCARCHNLSTRVKQFMLRLEYMHDTIKKSRAREARLAAEVNLAWKKIYMMGGKP